MTVAFIFRKPNPAFFSIERVFFSIGEELKKQAITIDRVVAPEKGVSLHNIRFIRSFPGRRHTDIYHVTGDMHYIVWGLPRRNTLLTIHDCVFLYQTKGLKRWLLKKLFLDWPVSRCKMITTISDATKKDILQHTGCKPEKITVIPDPVNEGILYHPHTFREEYPEILFVGTTPNKNLGRVIPALEDIPCRLHIIGEVPDAMMALLKGHRIDFRQSVRLTDEEMAAAYVSADLVLFPSLFEGFGLPIVEAQKTGRAVITSNLSPMKEVAGKDALLIDPHSVDAIRAAVLTLIRDKEYRERLVKAGLQNAGRFDTKTIAEQYLACYRQLLAN